MSQHNDKGTCVDDDDHDNHNVYTSTQPTGTAEGNEYILETFFIMIIYDVSSDKIEIVPPWFTMAGQKLYYRAVDRMPETTLCRPRALRSPNCNTSFPHINRMKRPSVPYPYKLLGYTIINWKRALRLLVDICHPTEQFKKKKLSIHQLLLWLLLRNKMFPQGFLGSYFKEKHRLSQRKLHELNRYVCHSLISLDSN